MGVGGREGGGGGGGGEGKKRRRKNENSKSCMHNPLTVNREIFTLKIIHVKSHYVVKFLRFRLIHEIVLMVDEHLDSNVTTTVILRYTRFYC